MEQHVRVLQLEDNEADSELVALALRRAGILFDLTRVEREATFLAALERGGFDLIVSDFSLPDFNGLAALARVRARDQDTPFIFVSGTIGEERAVEALRNGATDYILKDRLSRLPEAVRRALQDREARRARREADERIREQAALLDEARDAIVVQDLQRAITYWSRGAVALYGWSAEEAALGKADARFPADSAAALEGAWRSLLETGRWDGSLRQARRDGAEIIVESHWTCLRHADGTPRAVMSISSDVTQARNLEAQLLRTQRLETVGTIASGVAHDLNNVLAPIMIGIGSLKRKVTDDSGQRLLGAMEVSAERGSEIVRQVLTFARGTGEPNANIQPGAVIQGIEKLLAATLPGNVQLELRVPSDLWPLCADPTQIQQVLLNLCVNGRDAMPSGGRLTIEAKNVLRADSGRYVRVSVSDTGHGMDAGVRHKVFEPFFTTKKEGTGIGLSTVASIVKRHGGFIDLESEVGVGTSFKVYLPAAPEQRAPERRVADRPPQGQGRWLLVVDEASLREMMRETLVAYGYRVICAASTDEALREYIAHEGEIAAVLVNRAMSGLEDKRLVEGLCHRRADVRIIDSGRNSDGVPYTPDALLEVVGQMVNA
jgi:two-component system cell cycle sensor histidine kinase/response regulator CckA